MIFSSRLISFTCFSRFLCFCLCSLSLLCHFLKFCFFPLPFLFVVWRFVFPFSLHSSLSCYALLFLVPFPRAISCIPGSPDKRGRGSEKHCHPQCTILTQTPTHRCQPGDFPPSFSFFTLLLALRSLLLLSLCSLSLCC